MKNLVLNFQALVIKTEYFINLNYKMMYTFLIHSNYSKKFFGKNVQII